MHTAITSSEYLKKLGVGLVWVNIWKYRTDVVLKIPVRKFQSGLVFYFDY